MASLLFNKLLPKKLALDNPRQRIKRFWSANALEMNRDVLKSVYQTNIFFVAFLQTLKSGLRLTLLGFSKETTSISHVTNGSGAAL